MSTWTQDFRYALRQLRSNWRFTVAATLTLALGIGASTAVYSLVHAVVLRPLPFPDADRLVKLWETHPRNGELPASDPTFLDWRDESESFALLAAWRAQSVTLRGAGEPERIEVAAVTGEIFPALGVEAARGRVFLEATGQDTGERLAVLSHGLWQRRYGADPTLVGRTVSLDGERHLVIGVMPAGFAFPDGIEAWVPLRLDPDGDRDNHDLEVVGRLRDGVGRSEARSEMNVLAARLAEQYPAEMEGYGVGLASLHDAMLGAGVKRGVLALFGAVGLLLVIACANVSNLLLVRAAGRRREISIRTALGAGRGRIVRLLQIESQILALAGAGLGFLVASWAVPLLIELAPHAVPRLDEVAVDFGVFAFAVLVSTISMGLCALAPVVYALRGDLNDGLRDGGRGASSGGGRRLREVLAAGEVALALVVVLGAGLMVESYRRLAAVDPGFEPRGVVAVPLPFPDDARERGDYVRGDYVRGDYVRGAVERIADLPAVSSAGVTSTNPLRQFGFVNTVTPEDRVDDAPFQGLVTAGWRTVTPSFFETVDLPLVRGRVFDDGDREGTGRVMVLTRNLADELWPGEDPLGRRLFFGSLDGGEPFTVIGVVENYRDIDLAEERPLTFLAYEQMPLPFATLVARVRGDVNDARSAIRGELTALAPDAPVGAVEPLAENLAGALARPRFHTTLLALFAALSLLLAATGIYGILAFAVRQRRREIGIRMALGAAPGQILRHFLGAGLRIGAAGIAAGLAGAWVLTRFLENLLYETRISDLSNAATAIGLLMAVSLTASLVPSRRATRIDPTVAIGDE